MPNKIIPTPFEAIKQNNMAAFKAWLEAGGNPNAEDENGNSLVELLATRHNLEGIKILSPYNPDMSVKRNSVGEFSKNIINLTDNKELQNFIQLETAFYEKDFKRAEIIFGMNISLKYRSILSKQSQNLNNQPYKQIAEFIKLKLETLNINSIQNNQNFLEEHMQKLDHLHKFIKNAKYFPNRKFLNMKYQK
ncbi:hypothetical protein A3306_03335 [Rickettsia bellii]|uniref:Uncharacterized protein n=1 Tax=Rickettsia bellii str. RML An4 TaxID=1359193 RepID=A0A0F3QCF1_RICBE|nr:hypothetical protein [Rickettsia bellii]ARD86254.1 hypothetical protein A3306_03335 [Rickettsia bellii]KJV90218.1 hypothetical protein RBEAN4_1220 [Rickettsia bellii str. RML An4]